MKLEDFFSDFIENTLIDIEDSPEAFEEAVTNDILEYLKDCGEVLEPEICSVKMRNFKVNAFDYSDENESIDLFVTIAKKGNSIQKISDTDVISAFEKPKNTISVIRNGDFEGKIQDSNDSIDELIGIINDSKNIIKNARIFVLTNGICSANIVPKDYEDDGYFWDYELWDIERIFQQYLIRSGKQKIEIDFENEYRYQLRCLQMDDVSSNVVDYIAILPATILADMYGRYKQGLLEKNVRTFLQFKAKVNAGIRETIKNTPDLFLAYNNGISTTADYVDVKYEEGIPFISKIENLQIVNGGQTTASIYYSSGEKGVDLSKVFVQMKISVIKKDTTIPELVSKISRYANSQTAVKKSDFSSNLKFHTSIEDFSRSEWIPVSTGAKSTSKWYYERIRGQYLDERSRLITSKEKQHFDIEYPKKLKFNKTDLAKFEMCWLQQPFDVCLGGEKNFNAFEKYFNLDTSGLKISYFHKLIAKAILLNTINRIFFEMKLGSYRANVAAYVLAWISYKTNKKLNLEKIWMDQMLTEELNNLIRLMIPIVFQHITTPSRAGMNITDWYKKQECWLTLKDKTIDLSNIEQQLMTNEDLNNGQLLGQYSQQELDNIEKVSEIKSDVWFLLAKWAKENQKLTAFDRTLAYNVGILMNRKKTLSPKQAKNALRIYQKVIEDGFTL
ncbi:MAG: AIPR family protein [Bacteroidia bacterium]|nr:AIPR family protein [Bacteroidia bacterium]